MIIFKNLTKKYDDEIVLRDVEATINETGFYLLLGESGSGKTTFLNILAGLLSWEKGEIIWDDTCYKERIPHVKGYATEYITQESFFVDYLTVYDNLRITGSSEESIKEMLSRFGLASCLDSFPPTLSGGERQRLAIIRGLLQGKKILLLDEPTAALDKDNKEIIFTLLEKLSHDCLVICATHDESAFPYADTLLLCNKDDHIVRVEKPKKEHSESTLKCSWINDVIAPSESVYASENKSKNPVPFLYQWFRSKRKEKQGTLRFLIFLAISICCCMIGDTAEHKWNSTAQYMIRSNAISLIVPQGVDIKELTSSNTDISELILSYSESVPQKAGEDITNGQLSGSFVPGSPPTYLTSLFILPRQESHLNINSPILYGRYFNSPNEAIITLEMAQELSPAAPDKAVSKSFKKNLYNLGEITFTVVGILRNMSLSEWYNISGFSGPLGMTFDGHISSDTLKNVFFVHPDTYSSLESDKSFYFDGNSEMLTRRYVAVFSSTKSAIRFENENDYFSQTNIRIENYSRPANLNFWTRTSEIFLLLSGLLCSLTVLFYVQLKRIEFIYNHDFIAVFEHLGYEKKRVLNSFIMLELVCLLKRILLTAAVACIIMTAVNLLNDYFVWIPIRIFSYNPVLVLSYMSLIIFSAVFSVNIAFRSVNTKNWYELLLTSRDIL